jgi:hypothetical protein
MTADKYLGLPTLVWDDRPHSFLYLLERVIIRLEGWKERKIYGGRKYCLKLLFNLSWSMSCQMSVFNIPKKLCKAMTGYVEAFWWGDNEEGKRMH